LSKKEKIRNLKNNILSMLTLQGVNFIIPLILLPILVNNLGNEKFGLLIFAQVFINYFNLLVNFGFDLSATRQISIHRNNDKRLSEIFYSVFFIRLILLLFSIILLYFILKYIDKFNEFQEIYWVTFISVIGQFLFPLWFFQGLEKMKYITIINTLSKIFFLILTIILIKNEDDYIVAAYLYSFGFLTSGLFSIFLIYYKFPIKFLIPSKRKLRFYFLESLHFFLSRVSVSLYTSSNVFILGLVSNYTVVGYYSIALKIYSALQSLYITISTALYPYMAKNKDIPLFKKLFIILVFINLFMLSIVYTFEIDLFKFLFNNYEQISIQIFNILLLVSLISMASILLGYPLLAALGYKKISNNSVIFGSFYHIIALFILYATNNLTIYTIAYLLVSTEILVLSIKLYAINKFVLIKRT
jgi:polysaccharide transporter, PST family